MSQRRKYKVSLISSYILSSAVLLDRYFLPFSFSEDASSTFLRVTASFALVVPLLTLLIHMETQQAAMDQVGEAEVNVGTFHFGLLYTHPLAQRSEQIAVYWWLRAACRGQRKAQLNLGSAFYTGKGIAENHNLAILWWRRG
jgi:hypothetical protein